MVKSSAIKQDEPERKQTGVKLDLRLWREFKSLAVKQGSTAYELLEQAMRDYLLQKVKKREEKPC